jgi:outer membrane protein OmpA-like peptidoglycan-associated protein
VYPPTPTTTTTVAPSLNPVISPTPPTQGSGTATEGGQPVIINIVPNQQTGTVSVSGPGWSLNYQATNTLGAPQMLPDGTLLLDNRYGTFSTNGVGYQPGSNANVYLLSTPTLLGTVRVDASGSFSTTLPIPSSIGAGRHTIQVNGLSPNGQLRSASLGVRVVKTTTLTRTVLFDANSAAITLSALRGIERFAERIATLQPLTSSVRVLGYVQPGDSNPRQDRMLSLQRARNVAKFLRGAGVQGVYDVQGLGRAKGTSPRARRVVITVIVSS